jgi:CRP-like cAMP-binding protein
MAGTSRETISRVVHMFIKKGHLDVHGNRLVIQDYEKFKSLFT